MTDRIDINHTVPCLFVSLNLSVSQWNLVCSWRPLKQMIQTIYMGGVLTGAIIYGSLSDRWDLPFQSTTTQINIKSANP